MLSDPLADCPLLKDMSVAENLGEGGGGGGAGRLAFHFLNRSSPNWKVTMSQMKNIFSKLIAYQDVFRMNIVVFSTSSAS